jgi:hypothetical protein
MQTADTIEISYYARGPKTGPLKVVWDRKAPKAVTVIFPNDFANAGQLAKTGPFGMRYQIAS